MLTNLLFATVNAKYGVSLSGESENGNTVNLCGWGYMF